VHRRIGGGAIAIGIRLGDVLLLPSVIASLFGIRLGVFGFLSGNLGVEILAV
jgi:hypothetical protein